MTRIDWDSFDKLPFKVVVTYSGSNDEGYIEEVRPEDGVGGVGISDELESELEQLAYDILEERYAGWEINEGSHGHLTFDFEKQEVFLHHGEIVESTNWHDVVIT